MRQRSWLARAGYAAQVDGRSEVGAGEGVVMARWRLVLHLARWTHSHSSGNVSHLWLQMNIRARRVKVIHVLNFKYHDSPAAHRWHSCA